jgi:hypothetical protein
MSTQHQEFPELKLEARAAFDAAIDAIRNDKATISCADLRRALAASQREAMKQAGKGYDPRPMAVVKLERLEAIANNLHSPLPPPPTLAEARAADLDTPAGRDVVRDFLASLGEGAQS